ncbi:PREDICTED: extensin-like [Lupinus angustifolius]|uniref:extensin-like n=1 Tax=Lupinus angustifolius TaxID=3871 RepID=UPI00092EC679|nr:PREDICTED: extensin-like [Lupinus angustifolius]
MPPKTAAKELDDTLLQLFAHNTTPQPLDPPQQPSAQPGSSSISNSNPTSVIPPIPNLPPSPAFFPNYTPSPVSPFFTPHNPYGSPVLTPMTTPNPQPRPPKLQLIHFDGSEPLD